jgi:hypothetical protein
MNNLYMEGATRIPTIGIVGTRDPDGNQYLLARYSAEILSSVYECMITTGGADGIDLAAMVGTAPGHLTVYLPWDSYKWETIPAHARRVVANPHIHAKWFESVDQFHPAPARLGRGVRALHARNYGIVEHDDLVLAFPNNTGGGGTGQAIRIAKALGIPLIQVNRGSAPISKEVFMDRVLDALKLKQMTLGS